MNLWVPFNSPVWGGRDHTGGRRPVWPRMDWSGDGVCGSCLPPGILALKRCPGGWFTGAGRVERPPALTRGRAGPPRNMTAHTLLPARPACSSEDLSGGGEGGGVERPHCPSSCLWGHFPPGVSPGPRWDGTDCLLLPTRGSQLALSGSKPLPALRSGWSLCGHCERVVGTSDWLY